VARTSPSLAAIKRKNRHQAQVGARDIALSENERQGGGRYVIVWLVGLCLLDPSSCLLLSLTRLSRSWLSDWDLRTYSLLLKFDCSPNLASLLATADSKRSWLLPALRDAIRREYRTHSGRFQPQALVGRASGLLLWRYVCLAIWLYYIALGDPLLEMWISLIEQCISLIWTVNDELIWMGGSLFTSETHFHGSQSTTINVRLTLLLWLSVWKSEADCCVGHSLPQWE